MPSTKTSYYVLLICGNMVSVRRRKHLHHFFRVHVFYIILLSREAGRLTRLFVIPGGMLVLMGYGNKYGCPFNDRGIYVMSSNPRQTNGSLRRKHRARFKAMAAPCGICKGRLGPIHYDEPSDSAHPLSFVIDEVRPVSRWKQYGYPSARACAEDWNNLQAAHYCCNQAKGNKVNFTKLTKIEAVSGDW